jgi:hypothetical protein
VLHRGSSGVEALEVGCLLPNTLYLFRLRHMSVQASSALSGVTRVYTPPLPPFAPVVIDVQPRLCRLRWQAAQCGAAKFVVEVKRDGGAGGGAAVTGTAPPSAFGGGSGRPVGVPTLPVSSALVLAQVTQCASCVQRVRMGGGGKNLPRRVSCRAFPPPPSPPPTHTLPVPFSFLSIVPASHPQTGNGARASVSARSGSTGGDWMSMWEGRDDMTTLSNLVPGAAYRVRVVALNADGLPSAPSPVVMFSTPDAERCVRDCGAV